MVAMVAYYSYVFIFYTYTCTLLYIYLQEALYDIIPGVDLSPAPPPHQAPPPHTTPPTAVPVKPIKSTLQVRIIIHLIHFINY